MKTKIRLLIVGAVLANMPACTYIKNLFPDKEKDYQFTTEIPPLVLPPDLSGDSTAKVPTASATEATDAASGTAEGTSAASPTETVPDIDRKLIRVELLDSEQENKRLHITAPIAIAWRMVAKALSRNSIEVTNRNQEEKLFHVQYDPDRKELDEDESFFDEVEFFFKGIEVTEQEYVLKLAGDNQQSDVFVMDKDQQPATDKKSLSLLTLLHDTMKADLAK